MYEDLVAAAQRSSEAAVRESQERVDLAVGRAEAADKQATEASKAIGERWTNRINAMRRRAADRAQSKSTEMNFGHEDGPQPADKPEHDELVSLTEQSTAPAAAQTPTQVTVPAGAEAETPPFGLPAQPPPDTYGRHAQQQDRFLADFGPDEETPPAPQFTPPPTRRAAPPRRSRPSDDEDDYSGQSWLEGR